VSLERLWAGWRSEYVAGAAAGDGQACLFCRLGASDEPDEETYVLWRGRRCAAALNAFPYTSGHLMVFPLRHVGEMEDLKRAEATELWDALTDAVRALKAAYGPDGVNLGVNLGRAAGAGIPGHFHAHALPRWNGDTNFMTAAAEVRVLPESLPSSWKKLRAGWPSPPAPSAAP